MTLWRPMFDFDEPPTGWVPVEPCVHGNYARHLLTILENFERVYCDGVGVEGTE